MTSGNHGYLDDLFIMIGSGRKERIRKRKEDSKDTAKERHKMNIGKNLKRCEGKGGKKM